MHIKMIHTYSNRHRQQLYIGENERQAFKIFYFFFILFYKYQLMVLKAVLYICYSVS